MAGAVGAATIPPSRPWPAPLWRAPGAQRGGIKGLAVVTGDYDDAAKGREAATTMVGNGADVIWHAADVTGLGAMQGAAAAKVKAIGSFSDQTEWRKTTWRPASSGTILLQLMVRQGRKSSATSSTSATDGPTEQHHHQVLTTISAKSTMSCVFFLMMDFVLIYWFRVRIAGARLPGTVTQGRLRAPRTVNGASCGMRQ